MEKIKFDVQKEGNGVELRCRDDCPCGFKISGETDLPLPERFQ